MTHTKPIRIMLSSLVFVIWISACENQNQVSGTQNINNVVTTPSPQSADAELVIQGGTLLDMIADSPSPVPVKGIVIRDGKIDRIVAMDSPDPLPRARRIINADGQYILPGLIDSHVHFKPWVPDASIWRRASLYFGVTSLFDTGPCGEICSETGQDANEWTIEYRDFMNDPNRTDGPTLYITGVRIDGPEGTPQIVKVNDQALISEYLHHLVSINADGVQVVRVNNRAQIAEYLDHLVNINADGIKVESTLPADLRKIVMEEATRRGLPVVGHSKDARESIAAGMKFIEHMSPVTSSLLSGPAPDEALNSPDHDYLMDLKKAPELIQLMVENDIYLNPTLVGRYGYYSESKDRWAAEDLDHLQFGGLFNDIPEDKKDDVLDYWKRTDNFGPEEMQQLAIGLSNVETFLKLFSEAGGKVLAGTDAGQLRITGLVMHRELQMFVDAGISPYRALLSATRWAAESMQKEHIIGTIHEGKQADIIVLGTNPVANITNARDIQYVIRMGRIMRSPEDCSVIFPPVSSTCN